MNTLGISPFARTALPVCWAAGIALVVWHLWNGADRSPSTIVDYLITFSALAGGFVFLKLALRFYEARPTTWVQQVLSAVAKHIGYFGFFICLALFGYIALLSAHLAPTFILGVVLLLVASLWTVLT